MIICLLSCCQHLKCLLKILGKREVVVVIWVLVLHFLLQRFNNPFFPRHVFFILVKLSLIIIINTLFILQKMDQLSFKKTAGSWYKPMCSNKILEE